MKLLVGNQTSYAAKSMLQPFEFALEHGFEAFEFFPDRGPSGDDGWDERGIGINEREYIRHAAEACDLVLTVHAPLAYQPLREPRDGRLASTMEFARDIGARLVNLHLDMRQGAEAFGQALNPVIQATRKARLQLTLENTVWTPPEDFNAFFRWLRECAKGTTQHVGMCFDLGHANLCEATRNDYCGYLDRLSPEVPIVHLHLHENYGDHDSHLPLFSGPSMENPAGLVGLLERLRRRGFSGCGILEQWPQPPEGLVAARDRLRLLLNAVS
jgi:sugar phosphate isomerase/epimerase